MTRVAEVMTRGLRSMSPTDTLQFAAQAMDELNVGTLPVYEHERVVGMVTDRDITVRGVAQGLPADRTPLSEVMSAPVECCREDDRVEDVMQQMMQHQIRRLVVLDADDKLVGMLSLGDVAAKLGPDEAGEALAEISLPSEPDRSGTSAASGEAGGGSASGQASRMPD
jgi:CBS domain-containing protein